MENKIEKMKELINNLENKLSEWSKTTRHVSSIHYALLNEYKNVLKFMEKKN